MRDQQQQAEAEGEQGGGTRDQQQQAEVVGVPGAATKPPTG